MVEEKSNKARNLFIALFIVALACWFIFHQTEVQIEKEDVPATLLSCSAFIPEVVVCDVCEVCTLPIDYLEVAKEIAIEELIDDLDDSDLDISYDKIYKGAEVVFDLDDEGDYVVIFTARVELFNEDDYEDAEDEDQDYDAPLEIYNFEVKWDESKGKFRVSY